MVTPTYNVWISSDQTTRQGTSYPDQSYNSEFACEIRFPEAPSGYTWAMKCTAFKIDAPTDNQTRGQWDPKNEPTTGLNPAGYGLLGVSTGHTPTPSFTAMSNNNAMVNWFRDDPVPLALFDADTGADMQSVWTLITPPASTSSIVFTLRSSTTTSFLVNRAQGSNDIEQLNNWSACISFLSMSNTNMLDYYPFQPGKVNSSDFITNYTDEFPDAPIVEALNRADAVGTVQFNNSWFHLNKTAGIANEYWQSSWVAMHVGNTTGSSVDMVADVYFSITDATAPFPAGAFAGKTPDYTTPIVVVPNDLGGTTNRDFVLTGDDVGFYNLYLVFRVAGSTGTLPPGVVVEFENGTPGDDANNGACGGNPGVFNFNYYASPA